MVHAVFGQAEPCRVLGAGRMGTRPGKPGGRAGVQTLGRSSQNTVASTAIVAGRQRSGYSQTQSMPWVVLEVPADAGKVLHDRDASRRKFGRSRRCRTASEFRCVDRAEGQHDLGAGRGCVRRAAVDEFDTGDTVCASSINRVTRAPVSTVRFGRSRRGHTYDR